MKERPIIFSGDMVRAILDGRKSMTRRPMKNQPSKDVIRYVFESDNFLDLPWRGVISEHPFATTYGRKCPYGQPGDKLWVRETWCAIDLITGYALEKQPKHNKDVEVVYKASSSDFIDSLVYKWFTPRFMPEWASRITLEIVNVRVERLQEITIDGLYAEGWNGITGPDPIDWFKGLWDSLYTKKPEFQWLANPWVWVIEFQIWDTNGTRKLA